MASPGTHEARTGHDQRPETDPSGAPQRRAGLNAEVPSLRGARVIVVFETLELGGAERQGLLLARHLQREAGARVEIRGLQHPGALTQLCDALGIPWRLDHCPSPADRMSTLRSLTRLAWALRRARPDVILPYTMRPNVLCGLLWCLAGARLCVWNQRDAGLQRMGPRLERHAVARVPLFVANSLPARDFLVNELGLAADRVRLVSNGVELAPPLESRAGWRRRLGLGERDFAACMVANLHPFKDHATLLRAWRSVVDAEAGLGGRAVLLLAGKPFQPVAPLEALATDLGVAGHVRFLGQVIDVAGLLAACDVAVLSSPREGMPNAVLEAMASGRAVAGTDNPGMRGVVGPAGVRFLAPPGDAPALAERILWLARDPTLRARIGETHRRRVAAEFSPERMCREMAALLEDGLK